MDDDNVVVAVVSIHPGAGEEEGGPLVAVRQALFVSGSASLDKTKPAWAVVAVIVVIYFSDP